MDKWLCLGALAVAGLMLLLFLLDLVAGWPFGQISVRLDIVGILAALVISYLAYDTYKEVK